MSDVILMYHRVCDRGGARPWFARGTAVTPVAFERQLEWLLERYDVVPLRSLLSTSMKDARKATSSRPRASITFDDGYADVVREALPICETYGVVGMVFPVQGHLDGDQNELWFDHLYRLLESAIEPSCMAADPIIKGRRLSRWVRGPEKAALQRANDAERRSLLEALAVALDVRIPPVQGLYLSRGDLRNLANLGWGVGAHGVSHSRLTDLDDISLRHELAASTEFVKAFDRGAVVLAYPDGAHDGRVQEVTRSLGVEWALTVEPGVVDLREPTALPRFFARGEDRVPSQDLLGVAMCVDE